MNDLISRQAAIDALARTAREKFNLSDEFKHYLAGLMDGENAIRQLPSAQPEKICVAKVTMTDEQVKEAFENAKMEILALHPDLKKGKWIETVKHYKDDEQEYDYIEVNCSECGARRKIGWRDARCCPNCGVKIEGVTVRLEQEGEDEAD